MPKNDHKVSNANLEQLINSHPSIQSYFSKYVTMEKQFQTIQQMLLQAIQLRLVKHSNTNNTNKYHVAYVKHNRFLSPSQKKEVTPKVTEIIPISNEKTHIIYGKPKIRPVLESGCMDHQPNQCPMQSCMNSAERINNQEGNLNFQRSNNQNDSKTLKIVQKENNQFRNSVDNQQRQQSIEIYLEPIKSPLKSKNIKIQTTAAKSLQMQDSQYDKYSNFISPKNLGHTQSNKVLKNKFKTDCQENYRKIESKIKHLIDRDKTQSKLRQELQKQKLKSKLLEKKQNQLIKKFKEKQEMQAQQFYRVNRQYNNLHHQLDQSSSDQSSSIQSQLVRKYSEIRRRKLMEGQSFHNQMKNNRQAGFFRKNNLQEECNCSCQSMSQNNESDSNESEGEHQKFDVKAYLELNIPSFR